MNFRDRLQKTMLENDITAAELSQRSGVAKSLISRYLSGTRTPKPENTEKLAKALHVSRYYLETGKEPEVLPDFVVQYGEDPSQRIVIEQLVKLDPDRRKQVENYIAFLLSQQNDGSSEASK